MKKSFKRKIATIMASLSLLSALSVPVSADNKNFSFNLSTGQSSVTSTYSTKDDNEPQAYVNVKGGNVSKSNYVYFRVYSSKNSSTKYAVSSNAKSTGKGKVNPKYTVTRKAGSKSYLRINASLYNVKVNGTWCS